MSAGMEAAGWDFTRGGEAAPRVRPLREGLGLAVEAALGSPAALRGGASGAALALRGVVERYGLAWRVEVRGAALAVVAKAKGRGRPREAALWWREGWRGGEALARLG